MSILIGIVLVVVVIIAVMVVINSSPGDSNVGDSVGYFDAGSERFPQIDCPKHGNLYPMHGFANKLYNDKYPVPDFDYLELDLSRSFFMRDGEPYQREDIALEEKQRHAECIKRMEEYNRKALAFGPIQPQYRKDAHGQYHYHECPICMLEYYRQELRTRLIEKATATHGGKYDYSKVEAITRGDDKVTVICPEHGEYKIKLDRHANGVVSCRCNKNLPDTVYLWKLKGAKHDGRQVYKVGVTRGRLGINRIKQVEKASGYEAEVLAMKTINGNAYPIENKLLRIGQKVYHLKVFDGATELRAMTNSEVYMAVSIIESSS